MCFHHFLINFLDCFLNHSLRILKEHWILKQKIMKVIHQVIAAMMTSMSIIHCKEINSSFKSCFLWRNLSLISYYSIFIILSYRSFITKHTIRNNRTVWIRTATIRGVNYLVCLRDASATEGRSIFLL